MDPSTFTYQIKNKNQVGRQKTIITGNLKRVEEHIIKLEDIDYMIADGMIELSKRQFAKVKKHIMWATQTHWDHEVIIIRTPEMGDVLTWIETGNPENEYYNRHRCFPICYLTQYEAEHPNYQLSFPGTNTIQCFFREDDLDVWREQLRMDAEVKRRQEATTREETLKFNPCFDLSSPLFEVVEVVKKTKAGNSSIKVGDIIQGRMTVMEEGVHSKVARLKGSKSSSTNWIKLYVNNECTGMVSPITFQKLFIDNFRVREKESPRMPESVTE